MRVNVLIVLTYLFLLTIAGCKKSKTEEEGSGPGGGGSGRQTDITKVDDIIGNFMNKYTITGASLAVTKNGKLVYQKGYGFADKEAGEKVEPKHRFRLASLSKTYTAAAILKLAEAGKVKLEDKIFGQGGVLGTEYGSLPYSTYLSQITVSHLLHNTSGGWGGSSGGDPIDQNPQMNNKDFFNWVLKNKPQKYAPGTRYDYSNMGFFIAGRVIEKLSGKSYGDYIKEMAKAFDDNSIDIAGPALSDRKTDEVKYYGNSADAPWVYVIALKRRDADGGLMTTARGVLKFVTAIDGSATRPDLLSPVSLKAMTTGSGAAPLNDSYGLGIGLWGEILYNYGSLPGTRTGFMRSTNGKCIALLLNFRQDNIPAFGGDLQNVMLNIINDGSIVWQDIDQF